MLRATLESGSFGPQPGVGVTFIKAPAESSTYDSPYQESFGGNDIESAKAPDLSLMETVSPSK